MSTSKSWDLISTLSTKNKGENIKNNYWNINKNSKYHLLKTDLIDYINTIISNNNISINPILLKEFINANIVIGKYYGTNGKEQKIVSDIDNMTDLLEQCIINNNLDNNLKKEEINRLKKIIKKLK